MMIQKTKLIISIVFLLFPLFVSAQSCMSSIQAVAPDSRYQNHGDGTVTDLSTSLMWQQCSEGKSGSDCNAGSATTHTWQGALQIPQTLNSSGGFAGYNDWRLPNIRELASLVEEQCYTPTINAVIFPGTISSYYWSASPDAFNSSYAWRVYFYNGSYNGYSRSNSYYVRLVRSGQ